MFFAVTDAIMNPDLAPDRLLAAYAAGIFPMADDEARLHWLSPDPRCILELNSLIVSRSLRSVMRRNVFEVTVDRAFEDVIAACADRPEGTWISAEIAAAYIRLHKLGFAHSVEAWREGELAGGLYGVTLGAAFFGESMFYSQSDASKVALVHLVERMVERQFELLDVQFLTDHLQRFGAVEISRRDYIRRLQQAITLPRSFADDNADD